MKFGISYLYLYPVCMGYTHIPFDCFWILSSEYCVSEIFHHARIYLMSHNFMFEDIQHSQIKEIRFLLSKNNKEVYISHNLLSIPKPNL